TAPTKSLVVEAKNAVAQQKRIIKGRVLDGASSPIPNASILVKGTSQGTRSDQEGNFQLEVPAGALVLQVSSLGYKTQEINLSATATQRTIVLEQAVEEIAETVVTGIFSRSKESFTGSSATFTAEELKMVGNQNILQSLRTLDPAFAIIDNNEFGSDPNTLPDI